MVLLEAEKPPHHKVCHVCKHILFILVASWLIVINSSFLGLDTKRLMTTSRYLIACGAPERKSHLSVSLLLTSHSLRKFECYTNLNLHPGEVLWWLVVILTHTSSVGHWADSGSNFAEPRPSSCSRQTPEVASSPLCWRLHLNRRTCGKQTGKCH